MQYGRFYASFIVSAAGWSFSLKREKNDALNASNTPILRFRNMIYFLHGKYALNRVWTRHNATTRFSAAEQRKDGATLRRYSAYTVR